ncbi:MAG: UPF0182 family protein, partial [Deltaproteobacteria bacterium]|nr:UPF0182 family protein [Deltaproteobacteria bacterium]
MFFLLGVLFLAVGAVPLFRAIRAGSTEEDPAAARRRVMTAVWILTAFVVVLIAVRVFLAYYTELFWFARLGFEDRFWTEITVKIILFFVGAGAAFAFFASNILIGATKDLGPIVRRVLLLAGAVLAVLLGVQASGFWEETLLYLNQAASGTLDPVFEKSVPFYLFSLPFYSSVLVLVKGALFLAAALILAGRIGAAALRGGDMQQIEGVTREISPLRNHLLFLGGLFFITQALTTYLTIFELMYSKAGVVTGVGWLDVNVRVPAYWITIGVHSAVSAFLFASIVFRGLLTRVLGIRTAGSEGGIQGSRRSWAVPPAVLGGLFLLNGIIPSIIDSYVVKPNEITLEHPFIQHNIDFTRQAYKLQDPFLET